jgi:cytochrome P450
MADHDAGAGPTALSDELYWDPFDVDIDAHPYDVWRRLRDEAPVYRNDRYGFYALSRHDDVEAAHRDPATFSSAYGTVLELMHERPVASGMMIFMDPPAHTSHRALVSRLSGRDLLQPDDIERVAAVLDARRSADAVQEATATVPPGESAVFRLVAGGRSASEAAHDLVISPGAAWTRLSRARQRIRTALSRPDEED